MPRLTRIYTATGDTGTTGLGSGDRVPKDHARIEAYGTVDELSSFLGVALAGGLSPRLEAIIPRIQNELFHLGSDLCFREEDKGTIPLPQIEPRHIKDLEGWIDELNEELGPLEDFVLPGGSPGAAALHVCRTVCRRAERCVCRLSHEEAIGEHVAAYLNRLSDLLFVMARHENRFRGVPEPLWNKSI
jgi:cob(I)alamin adenosyltransferase